MYLYVHSLTHTHTHTHTHSHLYLCLCSLLTRQLLRDPQVLFAGYKVPHPLEHKFVLRVQTTSDYSPQEALTNAIQDLLTEIQALESRFRVSCHSLCVHTHEAYVHTLILRPSVFGGCIVYLLVHVLWDLSVSTHSSQYDHHRCRDSRDCSFLVSTLISSVVPLPVFTKQTTRVASPICKIFTVGPLITPPSVPHSNCRYNQIVVAANAIMLWISIHLCSVIIKRLSL